MRNYSIYSNQSLPSGSHILDLMLLDATGTNSDPNNSVSPLSFDYAVVNETHAFLTAATSLTVPGSPTAHSSSSSTHTSTSSTQ
jgi:hypothetical protein